ncbi:MAG: MarR family winged helix-turn-helix transcriptional regulator [Bacillota bacterium]
MASSPKEIINELLVDVFNHILRIEQQHMREKGIKLSMNEIHVLEAIQKSEEATMTNVAKRLHVTVGTLTTSINRLVEKGYCERYQTKEDRRKVFIQLTKNGKYVLEVHREFHEEMIDAVIEDLKLEDNALLIESLEKLTDYFKDKY